MNLKDIEILKDQYLKEMMRIMNFSEDEFNSIKATTILKAYKKGTVLLKEGQFSQNTYYIIKGCLISYHIIDGEEKVTSFYTEKETFSPSCIVTKKPIEHYVECIEDCLVSIGTPESEKLMLEKFPRFEKLCRIYSEELLVKQKTAFDHFKIASPEQRYLDFVHKRPDLLQRVPQYHIASYLGLTPQSLSRIRKRLLKSEVNHHKIAI